MSTPRAPARSGLAVQTPTTGSGAAFETPTTGNGTAARKTPGTERQASAARTPHARAARRALDSRRTAMTPGGRASRRKSGRLLRDSPRDLLRNLSRRLAPTTVREVSSSSSPPSDNDGRRRRTRRGDEVDMDMDEPAQQAAATMPNTPQAKERSYIDMLAGDDDDDLPLDQPHMTLPLDLDDDDDEHTLRPHRSALLDADAGDADDDFANFTTRSIELARRAATQDQLLQARRFSRASLGRSSFGSMRMSDYIDGYTEPGGKIEFDLGLAAEAESAFFPEGAFDNLAPADDTFERVDDNAGDVAEDDEPGMVSEMERRGGLEGDGVGFGVVDAPIEGNETTFVMGQANGTVLEPDVGLEIAGAVLEPDVGLEMDAGTVDLGAELIPGDGEDDLPPMYDDYGDDNGPVWDDDDEVDEVDVGVDVDVGEVDVDGVDVDGVDEDEVDVVEDVDVDVDVDGVVVDDVDELDMDEVDVVEDLDVDEDVDEAGAADARAKTVHTVDATDDTTTDPRVKRLRLSARGLAYPSLPTGVVKRIAQTFAQTSGAGRAKLGADTVAALSAASDYFFEQVGVDLQRYAAHAGRRTIDESDMLLLMRRQRQVSTTATPFSLAQRFLPRELLQELRMIPDTPALKRRRDAAKPKPFKARGRASMGRLSER